MLIYFFLGLIVGILVRDIKVQTIKKAQEYKEKQENKGEVQFVNPISLKEQHESAKNIEDLLE